MSSQLHTEMIRAQRHEIAARSVHAHHRYELQAAARRLSSTTRSRIGRALVAAVATVALCLALTTAVAFSATRVSRISAQSRSTAVSRIHRIERRTGSKTVHRESSRKFS